MDAYSLINSETIEKHCREINHQFNTKEIAVLVCRCDRLLLEEKFEYYREILYNPEKYPDMDNVGNHNIGRGRKMSDLLKEEIDTTNFVIAEFEKNEDNTVYTLEYTEKPKGRRCDMGGIFKTLQDIHRYIKIEGCEEEYWSGYAVSKRYINSSFHERFHRDEYIKLIYKRIGEKKFAVFNYQYEKNVYEPKRNTESILGQIWIYVPTPFKEGDIVDTRSQYGKGIIKHLCTQDENYVKQADSGECSDSSDMTCYCYFLDNDNVYWECCHAYDRMEYVNPEDLEGFERILKTISSLVKKEICVDLFIDTYDFIKAEYARESGIDRLGTYTDEGLELAGLKRKNKNVMDCRNKVVSLQEIIHDL